MRFTILASIPFITLAAGWGVTSYSQSGCSGSSSWTNSYAGAQGCTTIGGNEQSVYVDPTDNALQMYLYESSDCSGTATYGEYDAISGCLDDKLGSFKVVNA